ncbi:MAG: RNA polymerase sigma factor [Bryobacterales bacterium]|nr:RNA polymerase sigma factor [Bryobacterales bacterium]
MDSIIEQHYDPLVRYLSLLSRDISQGQELAQEAFLRLHRELLLGKRIENAKAWLFRVAHNLAVDGVRLPKPEHSLSDAGVSRRVEHEFRRVHPDPESLLLKRERMLRLEKAIEELPSLQRHALFLRREGFRYREIAAILKIGETTVAEHVQRAIERLNEELHDAPGF